MKSLVWGGVDRPVIATHGLHAHWETNDLYGYAKGYGMDGDSHPGVDVTMPVGTPIHAIRGGKIETIRNIDQPGAMEVRVKDEAGHLHLYTHLSKRDVQVGDVVAAGERIGWSGESASPHLHFEHRVPDASTPMKWRIIDPTQLLTKGGAPVATKNLHVILVAGHNSAGDGGNADERKRTPLLAKAYLAAFTAAGISCEWLNPSVTTYKGLDGLASATARAIATADADLVVMIDLHFNGYKSGVHTIVAHNRRADGKGALNTAIVAGRVESDLAENNPLDVQFASALSKNIVAANPGMYLWDADGVMLENQSGVGNNDGQPPDNARLAMMAYTAPYRMKAIRVTAEHGGINDSEREDFYNRCANAAVLTVTTVLGTRFDVPAPVPIPEQPIPPKGDPGNPPLPAFLFGEADGYQFDPNGPVSNLWLDNGEKTDRWPRLVDVLIEGTVKWFAFSDGSVIVAERGKPVYYLDEVQKEAA